MRCVDLGGYAKNPCDGGARIEEDVGLTSRGRGCLAFTTWISADKVVDNHGPKTKNQRLLRQLVGRPSSMLGGIWE
jgi:hypothetical protein